MPAFRPVKSATLYTAGAAVLVTLVLTSVHHLYGARRFDTPWRAHVAHIAAWAGVLFGLCFLVAVLQSHHKSGRIAMSAFLLLAVAICVVWLGLYEGGYNHGLFPRSLYELPGDWFFEMTGVLQLPVGLFAGRSAWRAHLAFEASL